jgi:hypothetical protein
MAEDDKKNGYCPSSSNKRSHDRLLSTILTSPPPQVLAGASGAVGDVLQLLSAPDKKPKLTVDGNNNNNNSNNSRRRVCASCKESKLTTEFSRNQTRNAQARSKAKCHSCCVMANTIIVKPTCSICKMQKKASQCRKCSDGNENENGDDLVCKGCVYKRRRDARASVANAVLPRRKSAFLHTSGSPTWLQPKERTRMFLLLGRLFRPLM